MELKWKFFKVCCISDIFFINLSAHFYVLKITVQTVPYVALLNNVS